MAPRGCFIAVPLRHTITILRIGAGDLNGAHRELAAAVLDRQRQPRQQRDAIAAADHLHQRRQSGRVQIGRARAFGAAERQRLIAKAVAVVEQEHRRALEQVAARPAP